MKKVQPVLLLILLCFPFHSLHAQQHQEKPKKILLKKRSPVKKRIVKFGTASFYDLKFDGRRTASGEKHNSENYSAACNVLPLNTWVKVTNLNNDKKILVKINDRLHPKNRRLLDLSRSAAEDLDYISRGLTRVKVEVMTDFQAAEAILKFFYEGIFLYLVKKILLIN